MRYALAAAGTGGHVYPALAVAEALVARGTAREDVVFFGGDRLEATAVPDAGFAFVRLDVRGIRRSFTPRNATVPMVVRRAARVVGAELAGRGIDAAAVFGGYVTGPVVIGARRAGVPFLLHEQNAVPGMANRLARRYARRVLVAFEPAARALPGGEVVGNPLPSIIADWDPDAAGADSRARYGLDGHRPVLGVVGGSQGAARINEAVADLLSDPGLDVDVVHLTGPAHLESVRRRAGGDRRWHPVGYEDRMDLFYRASDLVLARSGAMTVSELAVTGTPSVLVPLPAGRGYQARNAAELERAGGAVVVPQARLEEAVRRVADLLSEPASLERMAKGAASVGRPGAAAVVAAALEELTDG